MESIQQMLGTNSTHALLRRSILAEGMTLADAGPGNLVFPG